MLRPKSPVPRNAQQNVPRPGPGGGGFQNQGSGMFPVNRPPAFSTMIGGNNNAPQMQTAMSMPTHMQMQMSGGNSQGHFPNQGPFAPSGPHFQHQQPQQSAMTQSQNSHPLNAFAAPFIPSGVDPNFTAAAMMGYHNPAMIGGAGVGAMGMAMNPGMSMGVMQQHPNQMHAQMQMQMMRQHEGMQTPFLMDPSMMQQQMQLGLAGIPNVPAMQGMGMGMGIGMNMGMGMGISTAGVGIGSNGMDISGMQMSSIPMNQFGQHQLSQFQPPFNASGDGGGGLRGGASGPNPSLLRAGGNGGTGTGFGAKDILSATPMRHLQIPPARQQNPGGGGAWG